MCGGRTKLSCWLDDELGRSECVNLNVGLRRALKMEEAYGV